MVYYKNYSKLLIALLAFMFLSCSSDDSEDPLSISVTHFETSYSAVKLDWKINRPSDALIQDLQIYRTVRNPGETSSSNPEMIANLPSNETTYTDHDVPYYSEVTYTIILHYTDSDHQNSFDYQVLQSIPKTFSRPIVHFAKVPFQVAKDPLQADVFHILEKSGNGNLKRYNSITNTITNTVSLTDPWTMYNRFHIVNDNEIYVANTNGRIDRISTGNYQSIATYNTSVGDELNAFAVDEDRIYYQDGEVWKYYSTTDHTSVNGSIAMSFDYVELFSPHTFFFLYGQLKGPGFTMRGFSPQSCNTTLCSGDYIPNPAGAGSAPNYSTDPNAFAWSPNKQKFASGYNGDVFDINTFQHEITLRIMTGERYFQFAYDNAGNLYATVQGEKIIQKFNASYQLVETIHTKLYPIFPMVTSHGLSWIGTYTPQDYWGYYYGGEFNFEVNAAIETF